MSGPDEYHCENVYPSYRLPLEEHVSFSDSPLTYLGCLKVHYGIAGCIQVGGVSTHFLEVVSEPHLLLN